MSRIIQRSEDGLESQRKKCSRLEKQQVEQSRGMVSLRDLTQASVDGQKKPMERHEKGTI